MTESADARFEAIRPRLLSWLKKRFGGKDPAADDAIAAGMLAAWQGLCRVPPGRYEDGAIAFRQAYFGAQRYLRQEQARRAPLLPLEELEEGGEEAPFWAATEPDFAPALIDRLLREEVVAELWELLTPHERRVLALRYFRGWEVQEIATALGTKRNSVHGVMRWALNRYRRAHGLRSVGCTPERLRAQRAARYGRNHGGSEPAG